MSEKADKKLTDTSLFLSDEFSKVILTMAKNLKIAPEKAIQILNDESSGHFVEDRKPKHKSVWVSLVAVLALIVVIFSTMAISITHANAIKHFFNNTFGTNFVLSTSSSGNADLHGFYIPTDIPEGFSLRQNGGVVKEESVTVDAQGNPSNLHIILVYEHDGDPLNELLYHYTPDQAGESFDLMDTEHKELGKIFIDGREALLTVSTAEDLTLKVIFDDGAVIRIIGQITEQEAIQMAKSVTRYQ